jgi:outer membrane protein assembly factor BamE (lipoprotein component of BamABCDE complex)
MFEKPSLILIAALLLGACALDPVRRLAPGATPQEVRAVMGEPWFQTAEPGSGMRWTFPTGPMGRHTYLAEFDAEGRLLRLVDVLNDKGFARLRIGKTTDEQVRQLFGPPYRITRFERLHQTAWDYRFTDAWNEPAIFSVIFDDQGLVVSSLQQREFYGNDSLCP